MKIIIDECEKEVGEEAKAIVKRVFENEILA